MDKANLELKSVLYLPKGKIAYCSFFDAKTKTHYTVPLKELTAYPTQEMIDNAVKTSSIIPK